MNTFVFNMPTYLLEEVNKNAEFTKKIQHDYVYKFAYIIQSIENFNYKFNGIEYIVRSSILLIL